LVSVVRPVLPVTSVLPVSAFLVVAVFGVAADFTAALAQGACGVGFADFASLNP